MPKVLVPIPSTDFDPTETGVPWRILRQAGIEVHFATPDGRVGTADSRMVDGRGLGILAPLLMADRFGLEAYRELETDAQFRAPMAYAQIKSEDFDALLLPGGHAKGMRVYLESPEVQRVVSEFFAANKVVGAICHGTLVAARSRSFATGKSVLYGRKTTGLTYAQEMTAWNLTRLWLADYYRTYETPLETELKSYLESSQDFQSGPLPLGRDRPGKLGAGFTVRDGNYLSARWPGDAHTFGEELAAMILSALSQVISV